MHTPYLEYLVKWNAVNQFFLTDATRPKDGMVAAPEVQGLGIALDPAKIEAETLVFVDA